ncbi:MAG: DUF4405 domain-containing protein [Candidatus Zipacnadales bacterium]
MSRVISVALTVIFLVVALTGLYMALVHPSHRHRGGPPQMAYTEEGARASGGPDRFGPSREPFFPKKLHEWSSGLFLMVAVVHIVLNWKALLSHFGLHRRPSPHSSARC